MARLVVLAESEAALGFRLAGAEAIAADDVESAGERLAELLSDTSVGMVAASATLLEQIDDALRRRAEASMRPVVVRLPSAAPGSALPNRREYLAAMLRRAIGFQITFPSDGDASSKP